MISREEAISCVKYIRDIYARINKDPETASGSGKDIEKAMDMAIVALRLNPDAARASIDEAIEAARQSERPKGRYIPDNRYQTLGNCSLCNGDLTMLDNFCPNCGADCRGEEE